MIVAPEVYFGPKTEGYGCAISYEEIHKQFLRHANDRRTTYRAGILNDVIVRAHKRIASEDPVVSEFWRTYFGDVIGLYPELGMRNPEEFPPLANSNYIVFYPKPVPLPVGHILQQNLRMGFVELWFGGTPTIRLPELEKRWTTLLQTQEVKVQPTGKHFSVRVSVPELNPKSSFASQHAQARQGMKAAYRLMYLSPLLPTD